MNLFQWLKGGGTATIPVQDDPSAPGVRRRYRFSGLVQGVGFRWEAKRLAKQLKLTGWVRNEGDGSVIMEAEGRANNIDALVRTMQKVPRFDITAIETEDLPCSGVETAFEVLYE